MNETDDPVVLIAEDDAGHARLIQKNLARAGLPNPTQRFEDGQAILDFLCFKGPGPHRLRHHRYLLLLDIRMPRVDGIGVLRQMKSDPELQTIPVIMFTTADDPQEVNRCYLLGCGSYIVKPIEYDQFSAAVERVGLFVSMVQVPHVN